MRTLVLVLAVSQIVACAPRGAPEQAQWSAHHAAYEGPDERRCAYEARAAFAGARERSIGDSIDNAVQEMKLRQMCLAARR